jgi:hypothetical protein
LSRSREDLWRWLLGGRFGIARRLRRRNRLKKIGGF